MNHTIYYILYHKIIKIKICLHLTFLSFVESPEGQSLVESPEEGLLFLMEALDTFGFLPFSSPMYS